jgi:flavin reductase (DIM6/NTAB) family NADH-FMN oxidoreductase RutF
VAAAAFASALAGFASGVVLLSTYGEDEGDAVLTATAFSAVSLEPPMVQVSVAAGGWMCELLEQTGTWAVSILAERHRALAARFAAAQRPSPRMLLAGVAHHRGTVTGALVVDDALAALESRTEQQVPAGDHVVVIGRVLRIEQPGHSGRPEQPGRPLVYFRRRYVSVVK